MHPYFSEWKKLNNLFRHMWADFFLIIKTSPVNGNKINHQYLPSKFQTVLKQEKYNLCCALHKAKYHIILFSWGYKGTWWDKQEIYFFFPNVGGATVFNDNLDVIEFYMFNSQLTRFLLFSGLSHLGRKWAASINRNSPSLSDTLKFENYKKRMLVQSN